MQIENKCEVQYVGCEQDKIKNIIVSVVDYYLDKFKMDDKELNLGEEIYSDLKCELVDFKYIWEDGKNFGKYSYYQWVNEENIHKIVLNKFFISEAENNLKQYYATHVNKISTNGQVVLENVSDYFNKYLLARELCEWLLIKLEGIKVDTDKKDEAKNKLSVAMKHFFALSYLEDAEGKNVRIWISKFLGIELERQYPLSMMNYGDKLVNYRSTNYAGEKKKGNEFILYRKLFSMYKDGRYDDGIKYLVKSVMLEDKRFIPVDEYEAFVQKYHPNNVPKATELEKNALLFLWDDCKMFRHTYPDKYTVDDAVLCMYEAVYSFMKTGSKDDAIDIYNCYSRRFLKGDKMQEFINIISSYESNASRLVQSHRDHYSHSAYVFILGLAIYHMNENYRRSFNSVHFGHFKLGDIPEGNEKAKKFLDCSYIDFYCGPESGEMNFLRLWGLTSLFHDIGYQYEIPFEQIKHTSEGQICFQYKNFDKYTDFDRFFSECEKNGRWDENSRVYKEQKEYKKKFFFYDEADEIQSCIESENCSMEDIISYHILRVLKRSYSVEYKKDIFDKNGIEYNDGNAKEFSDVCYVAKLLKAKPTAKVPFMDHAFFSAIITFRELFAMFGPDEFPLEFMDAITAIIMHNKFFEFCLKDGQALKLNEHPLAYLLILCDELQCWDRTSFGKGSIQEMHAIDASFKFENNSGLEVNYIFDKRFIKDVFSFNDEGLITKIAKGTLAKFYICKEGKKELVLTPENFKMDMLETYTVSSKDFEDLDKKSSKLLELENAEAYILQQKVVCKFLKGIEDIVDLTDDTSIKVAVSASFGDKDKLKKEYLSESSIRHLYNMAKNLFDRMHEGQLIDFEYTTLLEKLVYIAFIKRVGEGLHKIGCFYTNKPKVFDIKELEDFSADDIDKIFAVEKCMLDEFCERHLLDVYTEEVIEKMVRECIVILCESKGIEIYKLW